MKKIIFFSGNRNSELREGFFGCSSFGFSTTDQCISPHETGKAVWDHGLEGELITGTFEHALQLLSLLDFRPSLLLVFFRKNPLVFEQFLTGLVKRYPEASVIGGAAAIPDGMSEGELAPAADEVCILASPMRNFRIEKLNLYNGMEQEIELEPLSTRIIGKIRVLPDGDWQNAAAYFQEKQLQLKLNEHNFENICLCDKNGRNLHCSIPDGQLMVGAGLPEDHRLFLKAVTSDKAAGKLREFILDKDALIFGCAGIRSLIQEPIYTGVRSLAGFMFGEIVTCGEQAQLGNLMLTKLKIG